MIFLHNCSLSNIYFLILFAFLAASLLAHSTYTGPVTRLYIPKMILANMILLNKIEFRVVVAELRMLPFHSMHLVVLIPWNVVELTQSSSLSGFPFLSLLFIHRICRFQVRLGVVKRYRGLMLLLLPSCYLLVPLLLSDLLRLLLKLLDLFQHQ